MSDPDQLEPERILEDVLIGGRFGEPFIALEVVERVV